MNNEYPGVNGIDLCRNDILFNQRSITEKALGLRNQMETQSMTPDITNPKTC